MLAAVVDRYGPPEVLQIQEVDAPMPGPGECLVEVRATLVTEGDRRIRAADFPGISWLPGRLMMGAFKPKERIPGTMFAGRILALGEGAEGFAVGDDVFGSVGHSAYGERLTLRADGPMALMPRGATYEEAASLPYGAGTALTFLSDMAQVKPGEKVLILGASGGVGRYGVQIAKHLGARVTGVCSGRSVEVARSAGGDVVIDYTKEDFRRRGEVYDVIFDTADVASFRDVRSVLSKKGRFLTLFVSLQILMAMVWSAVRGGPKAMFGVDLGSAEGTRRIADLWSKGVLTPKIDKAFPLSQIVEAHAYQETRPSCGAVVIEVTPR